MTNKPAYKIITEEEFLKISHNALDPFFSILNYISDDSYNLLNRRYYSNLLKIARDLESFLDDHGAARNKTWVYFRELIASIRNIAIAASETKHTMDRFSDYGIEEKKEGHNNFLEEANKTISFLNKSILNLYKAAKEEGNRIGIKITDRVMVDKEFHNVTGRMLLPKTIDDGSNRNNEERILALTKKYRKIWKIFRNENLMEKREAEKLHLLIPSKMDVKKAQKLKNIIHNVQSDYDTYVKDSSIEKTNPNLIKLRGYVSIPLHLLEAVRWLLHFYERHEDEIRQGETNVKISKIINKEEILERMNNFSLYYSGWYLQKGNKIAEDILSCYINKVTYELPVPRPLGFHARPCTYISMIVNEHGTDVSMGFNDNRFNAKSVLDLMQAGGMAADLELEKVTFEGDKRVLDDLKILAEHNYCEDCDIPRSLNYLRIIRNLGK